MAYFVYIIFAVGTLSTVLLTLSNPWPSQVFGMTFVLLSCLAYLAVKAEVYRRGMGELQRLRAAYDQLDQQAKLIIRTDLELHRTQEELDRRLASLMSLYQFGRQLQVNLRPEEVYSRVDVSVVTNFGFSNGLLGMCRSFTELEWRSMVGLSHAKSEDIKTHLLTGGLLKQLLTNPAPRTLQVSTATDPSLKTLLNLLGVQSAVVAAVIPHDGPAGLLLFGRTGGEPTNPTAEEELVAILTTQLAIAVENSALYEKSWASQRELERKVQERTHELAEANANLVRLNKAKSDFVSAVSHELRTPLAAVKGYAALLGTGQFGALSMAQHERIAKIEKHADLLTELINNLLDIARIESGHVTMERRQIPVKEFFTAVHEFVHPQLDAKRIQFATDVDGVTQLVGDPQHLQRVFINLLSNAVKYTPEGGSIRVNLARDGDAIVASVSDTGCGISSEDLPKLFQEFYRANDPMNQQIRGTGLGLALVKRIVEAHHGRIWVTSEKGKGSTFIVSLPLSDASAHA
jgi:signal transduction histidine kinase